MTGPYGATAWDYWAAGWRGVLPLPAGAKWPPPSGYTGWTGIEPSGADVQTWVDGPQAAGNIALRLPFGAYGLDVDDYAGKTGGAALAAAVERLGPLPATWVVSSRDDGVSGIRLFRAVLPIGRRWRDEPAGHGAGIEAIHFGHRYAVTWPSTHPETGRKYVWRRPDGMAEWDGEVPRLDGLPEMPAVWVEALSEPGEIRTGEMAGHDEAIEVVGGWRDGEPCPRVLDAHGRALAGLRAAADGSALHPVSVAGVHELVNLGHEGHAGVRRALAEHYALHVEVRSGRDGDRVVAEREWWREVRGAIGKLPGRPLEVCDCALWAGDGLLFDPTEGLGDVGGIGDAAAVSVVAAASLADVLLERMLTPAQLRDRPAPTWLIEGLLTLDSASWLIAAAGSYKSFVALDWAGHVGAGRPWLGREVAAGGVVYVVAEGVGGMGPRIRAWEQRNGPMDPAVRFLPMPVQVSREDHWSALVEACGRLRPALILLDTQARITVGLDENDNTAMGEFVEAIERLRRATGACVLVVHHTGRNGQHARGASAIDGAQDVELRLTRTADRRATLVIDKSKNAADDVSVALELFLTDLDSGGTSLVVGAPLPGGIDAAPWREGLTENRALVLEILQEQFSELGGTRPEVARVLRERGQRGDPSVPQSTFYTVWNELLKTDKIERVHGTQRFVVAVADAP